MLSRSEGRCVPEYQLYCFAQSGVPIAPLMLNLVGARTGSRLRRLSGGTRTPAYRGESTRWRGAVLAHGDRRLTQSG
jgi:hypothetical protein